MNRPLLSRLLLGAVALAFSVYLGQSLDRTHGPDHSAVLHGHNLDICDETDRYGPVVEFVPVGLNDDGSTRVEMWSKNGLEGITEIWD